MAVIGINVKAIEAKRVEDIFGALKVNSNALIKDVKEQDLVALKIKGLSVEFSFKTEYIDDKNKIIGDINIGGNVIVVDDDYEKILKGWKKDKKLPNDINIQVINAILDKCSKKSIVLSDDLQLPPPVRLPFATKKENE